MRANAGHDWDGLLGILLVLAAGIYAFEKIAAGELLELAGTITVFVAIVVVIGIMVKLFGTTGSGGASDQ